jgi:hypothetical protein
VHLESIEPAAAGRPRSAALGELASALYESAAPNPAEIVTRLLDRLLPTVPAARWGSISCRHAPADAMTTPAATDAVARRADELQFAATEGPCLDASRGVPVVAAGPDIVRRWPLFGVRLFEHTPVRGVLSHPLPGRPGLGSMNLYADAPLPASSISEAAELAAICAVALGGLAAHVRAANLATALETSRRISAAIGIVMAQHRCTYDDAFQLIRSVSQRSHRKMRDLAEDIVFTGALPNETTAGR